MLYFNYASNGIFDIENHTALPISRYYERTIVLPKAQIPPTAFV